MSTSTRRVFYDRSREALPRFRYLIAAGSGIIAPVSLMRKIPFEVVMIIGAADQVHYPRLTRYVRYRLPEVANVATVQRAFLRFAQMDRTTLRRALDWGNQPTLQIVTIPDDNGSFINGEYRPGSNIIRLNRILAAAHENRAPPHLAYSRSAAGQEIPRICVTILHELVHWGDEQDGIDHPGEEGELFEQAVYGANIPG